MTEEIEKKLDVYLPKLLEYIESGTAFVVEQAPIMVREILSYYAIYHVLQAVMWGTAISVATWLLVRWLKRQDWENDPHDTNLFLGVGFSMGYTAILVGAICNVHHVYGAIKVFFAPRLYLLEYLRGVTGGN